jgi:hypothetical protein
VGRRGRFAAALRIRTRTKMHIHVNYKKVKVDLSKWLEEGKAHWPPGSKEAELAELVTKLFIAVEVVNLYNKLTDMVQTFSSQTSDATKKWTRAGEVVAATMDLVVAFEDPARAWAEEMSAIRFDEWRRLHPHAKPTELAEAKEEVAGVFGKLSKPATFKWIGALSAALDTAIYFVEGREAWHKGEHGVAVGNYLVSGGSFLMLVGNVVSAVSIAAATEGVTAATAAAAAFASIAIVIGVIIVMIGFALVEYFHETPWQTFADRCCFGKHPGKAGHEKWSGGDFSKWTLTEEGLDRQIEVLTAMLCAFRAEGDTGDNHTIRLYFGVVAPKSRLTLEFSISYENGQNQKLEYEIELDKINPALKKAKSEQPGAENAESEQPGTENAESEPHGGSHRTPDAIGLEIRNKRFVSMVVRAERLVSGPVKNSTCEVAIRFAGSSAKVPVEGEFKYQLVENGHIHSTEMDSLDVGPEE